jgi:hypothetical protein
MSLKKYESEIRYSNSSDAQVYSVLSDLSILKRLEHALENAELRELLTAKTGKENVEKAQKALHGMEATTDSVTFEAPMVGKVTLQIVEREQPKLIKVEAKGLPVDTCLWIQILPTETGSKIKVTAGAELNFFIKGIADQYLPTGVNNLAGILASLPYDKLQGGTGGTAQQKQA